MNKKILIVEDEFIVANDLRLMLQKAGYDVCGIAASVEEAQKIIRLHHPALVLLDIHLKGEKTGIDLAMQLREENIAFVYLSANSNQKILEAAKATQPYGFLVKPFREKDVLIALDIARYRHENSLETSLRKEQALQKSIAEITASHGDAATKNLEHAKVLQPYVPFDYLLIYKHGSNSSPEVSGFLRTGFEEYQPVGVKELQTITGLKPEDFSLPSANSSVHIYDEAGLLKNGKDYPLLQQIIKKFDLATGIIAPVTDTQGITICFFSRRASIYTHTELTLLERVLPALAGVWRTQAKQPAMSNATVQKPSGIPATGFEGIIGSSQGLLAVLDHLTQVAPVDTSVLILGESGTGKERIAQAIHQLSPRSNKPLVKINCAALPATLIESELFGHEKGAFTGATDKRIGKFEQADGGTIFLDEIGEMPLDMQVKLLRVLQEKEIERVGGRTPIKVNVRVIAATNRHLEKEVAEGHFRLDLYYRLNVFPLILPPLRERRDDMQQLAYHFAKRFCKKMDKHFNGIRQQTMTDLEAYDWPGNIRELENVVEQMVILNDGVSELELKRPLNNALFTSAHVSASLPAQSVPQTLTDVKKLQTEKEREYIISVLKKTNGRIRGEGGAAQLLDLNPTTLESRMAKLGIKKDEFKT